MVTVAWLTSGYWVEEWFPHMMTFFTLLTSTFSLSEIWPRALLWSRRVRHVMFFSGIEGANSFRTNALVFAGFATTRTCRGKIKGNNKKRTADCRGGGERDRDHIQLQYYKFVIWVSRSQWAHFSPRGTEFIHHYVKSDPFSFFLNLWSPWSMWDDLIRKMAATHCWILFWYEWEVKIHKI